MVIHWVMPYSLLPQPSLGRRAAREPGCVCVTDTAWITDTFPETEIQKNAFIPDHIGGAVVLHKS